MNYHDYLLIKIAFHMSGYTDSLYISFSHIWTVNDKSVLHYFKKSTALFQEGYCIISRRVYCIISTRVYYIISRRVLHYFKKSVLYHFKKSVHCIRILLKWYEPLTGPAFGSCCGTPTRTCTWAGFSRSHYSPSCAHVAPQRTYSE